MREITDRPFGVIAIAVIQLVKAGIAVWTIAQNDVFGIEFIRSTGYIDIVNLIIGLLGVGIAVGLWQLQRWAWALIMLVLGIDMGFGLFAYYQGVPSYLPMALNVVAVFYLNMHDVRRAFGRQPIRTAGAGERA